MAIVFKNSGLIDLRALFTFGWSVKEISNPIGQFGTGSRFGLATLLRHGCAVTLYRGLDRYLFGTKKVDARGSNTFDLITLTEPDGSTREMP